LDDSRVDEKFVIVHEAGHWIADARAQQMLDAGDTSIEDATCPAEGTTIHSMRSEEWAGGAASEGFAHFYSADVWNDDDEDDCGFEYWRTVEGVGTPAVDCEYGGGDFPLGYLEDACGGTAQHGVELDWLRAFWDVHTNGSTPPSFTGVANWLDNAGSWSRSNVYSVLDAEADDVGGSLETNWDAAVFANGIDH
jgi:hypothetical protein